MQDGASMPSTPTMKEADSHSAVVIDPEIVLAARADRSAAAIGPEAVRRPAERPAPQMAMTGPPALAAPTPTIDPAFRPSDYAATPPLESRSSIGVWVLRTGLAVLFAVFSAVAAAAWQTYGDQAQEMVGHWMPRISLASPLGKNTPATQTAATGPAANDDQAIGAPAQGADAAAPSTAAATAAVQGATQDSRQLLQSMAHDLAAMGQQIADLKGSIAQLKTSQDQMVQQMARAPEPRASEHAAEGKPFDPRAIEQTLRPRFAPRPAGAPAVATATPVHRPRPASPPPAQTFAPAPLPLPSAPQPQTSSDPGVGTVVRPPMPVR
jgi:hypothetical protein